MYTLQRLSCLFSIVLAYRLSSGSKRETLMGASATVARHFSRERSYLGVALLAVAITCQVSVASGETAGLFQLPLAPNDYDRQTDHMDFICPYDAELCKSHPEYSGYHMGEDWNGQDDCGDPVYALADGRVVFVDDIGSDGFGKMLIIRYSLPTGEVDAAYYHLSSIEVRHPDPVDSGDLVGHLGGTGGVPCHLHWEMQRDLTMSPYTNPYYEGKKQNGALRELLSPSHARRYTSPSLFVDDRAMGSELSFSLIGGGWTTGISVSSNAPSATAFVEYDGDRHSLKDAADLGLLYQYVQFEWSGTSYQYPDITKVFFAPGRLYRLKALVPGVTLTIAQPGENFPAIRALEDISRAVGEGCDTRFRRLRPSPLGEDLFWLSDWDLRWIEATFGSSEDPTLVAHATHRGNPQLRATTYFDLDLSAWTPWEWTDWNTGWSTRCSGAGESPRVSRGGANPPGVDPLDPDDAEPITIEIEVVNGATGSPNPVAPRGTVQLSVVAESPLKLSYAWSAACSGGLDSGTFLGSATPDPEWIAPVNDTGQEQTCLMDVVINDGNGSQVTSSYSLAVGPSALLQLSVHQGVEFLNDPPYDSSSQPVLRANIKNVGGTNVLIDRVQGMAELEDPFGNTHVRFTYADDFGSTPLTLPPGAVYGYVRQFDSTLGGDPQLGYVGTAVVQVKLDNIPGQETVTSAESAATAQLVFEVNPHTITITNGPASNQSPVTSGGSANMIVNATDSFRHDLTYSWSSACLPLPASGVFSNPLEWQPTWTAPINATGLQQACTIIITVGDGLGAETSDSFEQLVDSVPHVVEIIEPAFGSPNPVCEEGEVQLSVAAETTLEVPLEYLWTAACPGLGSNGLLISPTSRIALWVAPENDGPEPASCSIEVQVSDLLGASEVSSYEHQVILCLPIFADGFESGDTTAWSNTVP